MRKEHHDSQEKGRILLKQKISPFTQHQVEDYAQKRYKGLDQKLVHLREKTIIKKILRKIPEGQGMALDVPCGYGRFSQLLVERHFPLLSSDYSYHMVRFTQDQILPAHLSAGFVADAKQALPLKNDAVRVLLSIRFFQHVYDKTERQQILREFGRISSGWAIISFYQTNWLHSLQRVLRKKMTGNKRQIRMISRKQFLKGLQETDFTVKKIFPLFKGIHAQHIAFLKKSKLEQKAQS